jgi:general secretion pathway protein B
MSYILEALKKAQAERQLGSAPTIHAPAPIQHRPAGSAANRGPLLIGVGVAALALAVAGAVMWRQQGAAPAQVVAATSVPVAAPIAAVAPVPSPVAAPTPVAAAAPAQAVPPAPAPAAQIAPARAPAAAPQPPVTAAPAPVQTVPAPPAPSPVKTRAAKVSPREAAPRVANPAAAPLPVRTPPIPEPAMAQAPTVLAGPAVEDNIRTLRELPELIQREVPKVTFGGYIYSPNPADRLLLIDKMLRREGEEVAPGLVVERLLPKAAVMNYRGNRYRVAY